MSGPASPSHLRCEHHVDPIGIDVLRPRLSWQVADDRPGARQAAYEVEVASSLDRLRSGDADRWASGRVEDSTIQIAYGGSALRSRDRCWWHVRTTDAAGSTSPWSEPASFEMGLLRGYGLPGYRDWQAATIRSHVRGTRTDPAPAPFFRRSFELDGEVERARLYITALGLYEPWLNGQRLTDDLYRPGWTDYRVRLAYQTYDVTSLLRRGSNVLGAIVGDGWYCGSNGVGGGRQAYGERPALLAQLEVFVTGQDEPITLVTDEAWRTTTGPILEGDNYLGERYDARLELEGWSEPGYDDGDWHPVEPGPAPMAALVATVAPPIRATDEVTPIDHWESAPGVHVFDLGQNLVGHVRLRVSGAEPGRSIQLRHAEVLDADGRTVWTENLNKAKATDTYVCRGGDEVWEPRFTFHGFRYVEVTGYPGTPSLDDVTGIVKHSDMERTGTFTCSHDNISRLYENIVWSQRGNSLDVPTDCPQRAERLGWTGDIAMFARTAMFNYDTAAFLRKWVFDLMDGQLVGGVEDGQFPIVAPRGPQWGGGPAWADAAVMVPWHLYEVYGDTLTLREVYPSLERWMGFLERWEQGLAPGAFEGFGDWVALDFDPDRPLGFDDRWGGTPLDLLGAAFHAHATDLMGRIAAVLGRDADAAAWRDQFADRRAAFVDRFVDDGRLRTPTQTACTLALTFDLLPDPALRTQVGRDLAADVDGRGHLVTGFVGTPWLLHALEGAGRLDLAYRLIEREELPGWLYPVTQGATTMWERWDAWTPEGGFHPSGMNSFNHYAYGAVGHWLHRTIGGLDIDEQRPGTGALRIAPRPGGSITSAATTFQTIRGAADCSWQVEDGVMSLTFTVPANSSATVRVPTAAADHVTVDGGSLSDVPTIADVRSEADAVWFEASAGRYELTITDPVTVTTD